MHLPSLLSFLILGIHSSGGLCASLAARLPAHANFNDTKTLALDLTKNPATALSKRILIQDGGLGWLVAWESVEALVPVQEAAENLASLYGAIIDGARGEWSTTVAEHTFSRSIGNINFQMYCNKRPLPWPFIATFAERMLGTMQQAPSMYRLRIWHPNGRSVVRLPDQSCCHCGRLLRYRNDPHWLLLLSVPILLQSKDHLLMMIFAQVYAVLSVAMIAAAA